MRRARPSSWISGAAFLHPAGTSDSGAATAANADAAASPRERELRAALGSDEVLPNNVTLLMSRRQRGEESDGEEGEEDGELELEDVVLDDEEAGPGSAGGDGDAVAAGRTVAEQQQQHSIGGGAITPLIHQVLRRPLTWRVSLQMVERLVGVLVFPAGRLICACVHTYVYTAPIALSGAAAGGER